MTRLLLFIFTGAISLFLFSTSVVDAKESTLFPLYESWYETNTSVSQGDFTLLFDAYQPTGRLSLIQYSDGEVSVPENSVSHAYEWQFLDALVDNPLTARITNVPVDTSLAVYVNTSGMWQQIASKHTGNTVEFVIQSPRGKVVVAEGNPEIYFELPLAGEVLNKGYTIETPAKDLRVGIMPNIIDRDFTAKVRSLPGHYSKAFLPDNLHFVSEVYHVWLDSGVGPLPFSRALPIELQFPSGNDEYKAIYYFDPGTNTWNLSPSLTRYTGDETAEGYVRTLTYQNELIIAVVTDPLFKEWGKASWFSSDLIPRNRLGSANNDYPLGTVVRVTNLYNDKYVDTEIISRGPYADFRIIDLGSDVFKQIASLGAGVIDVKIEPIEKLP